MLLLICKTWLKAKFGVKVYEAYVGWCEEAKHINLWSIWFFISFVLMLLYEINWIRYFKGEHALKSYYGSFCGFHVASASLPVMAFLLLSIYGKVIWLSVSVIVLGIGHIGIHFQHLKSIK